MKQISARTTSIEIKLIPQSVESNLLITLANYAQILFIREIKGILKHSI